jgi:hypothetical protein
LSAYVISTLILTGIKTKSSIPNDGSDFSIIRTILTDFEGLSDIRQVTIDLSNLSGSPAQPMYDDGKTGGDNHISCGGL